MKEKIKNIPGITENKQAKKKKDQYSLLLALPVNIQYFWKHIFIASQNPIVGNG
jgi:hypothetical protein